MPDSLLFFKATCYDSPPCRADFAERGERGCVPERGSMCCRRGGAQALIGDKSMVAKDAKAAKPYIPDADKAVKKKGYDWKDKADAEAYFNDRAADVGTDQQAKPSTIAKAARQAKAQFGMNVDVSGLI